MNLEDRARQLYNNYFDGYQIGEKVGSGSQGRTVVFKVVKNNISFSETEVIKVVNIYEAYASNDTYASSRASINEELDQYVIEAENEIAIQNNLKGHPNIVSYNQFAFNKYYVDNLYGVDLLIRMDYLDNVGRMISDGKVFTETEVIKLAKDIGNALITCHSHNIIHRDIKPDNIFISRYGQFMLGDFGVAKIMSQHEDYAQTIIGSSIFAAPEQLHIFKNDIYDNRVDVYGLGLTLYMLANGNRIPFEAEEKNKNVCMKRRLSGEVLPPISCKNEHLNDVILKACQFRKEDRYATVSQLVCDLDAMSYAVVDAPKRKKKLLPFAIGGFVAVVVAAIVAILIVKNKDSADTDTPKIEATHMSEENISTSEICCLGETLNADFFDSYSCELIEKIDLRDCSFEEGVTLDLSSYPAFQEIHINNVEGIDFTTTKECKVATVDIKNTTVNDTEFLNNCTRLEKVSFNNCALDTQKFNSIMDVMSYNGEVTVLDLTGNSKIKIDNPDFSSMKKLKRLSVANCGFSGRVKLGDQKIEALFAGNTEISAVSGFNGERLRALDISNTQLELSDLGHFNEYAKYVLANSTGKVLMEHGFCNIGHLMLGNCDCSVDGLNFSLSATNAYISYGDSLNFNHLKEAVRGGMEKLVLYGVPISKVVEIEDIFRYNADILDFREDSEIAKDYESILRAAMDEFMTCE